MTRRLLNLLTLLSLLLCVAVCVLWVRSQFVMDHVVVNSTRNYLEFNGRRSGFWLLWIRELRQGPLWVSLEHESREPHALISRPHRWWHRLGLTFMRSYRGGVEPGSLTWVTAPYWLIAGSAAIPAVLQVLRLRRTRRQRQRGLCPSCGYDLRATPGRCPECGMAGSVSTSG